MKTEVEDRVAEESTREFGYNMYRNVAW